MNAQNSTQLTEAAHAMLAGGNVQLLDSADPTVETLLIQAWAANSFDEKLESLLQVLDLDPGNQLAQSGLNWIEGMSDLAHQIAEVRAEDSTASSEEEAAEAQRREEEAAEAQRLEEEAAEAQRLEEEAAEAQRLEEEAAEAQRLEEEAAEAQRLEEEAAEAQRLEEEAAEAQRLEEEAAEAQAPEADSVEDKSTLIAKAAIAAATAATAATTTAAVTADAGESEVIEAEIQETISELSDDVREIVADVAPATPTETATGENSKPLVLAVDDSPTILKLVTMTLTREGFEVITAADGLEALQVLAEQLPDIILSDVNMPRLDGYKLCRFVKKHERTKHIPVVMLSGKDGVFDKLRGKMFGCGDYITKPFESNDLVEKVRQHTGVYSN